MAMVSIYGPTDIRLMRPPSLRGSNGAPDSSYEALGFAFVAAHCLPVAAQDTQTRDRRRRDRRLIRALNRLILRKVVERTDDESDSDSTRICLRLILRP